VTAAPTPHWEGHYNEARIDLFCGGLPVYLSDRELFQMASAYGVVLRARHVRDRSTGEGLGFGFVRAASERERDRVLAGLDGHVLPNGWVLRAGLIQPSQEEQER
jgi:hypothetical protein